MISEFEFAIISKNNNLYFTLFFYYKVLIYFNNQYRTSYIDRIIKY